MNVFTWIKEKLGFGEYDFDDIEINVDGESSESIVEALTKSSKKRRNLDVNDAESRQEYIRSCCEMMSTASADVERQKAEYQQVLTALSDLDEIETIPRHDRLQLKKKAAVIVKIEDEEADYVRPQSRITEAQYRKMEMMEKEVPEVLKKLKENEDYQMAVRRDLNLLEGEKGAIAYQRKEDRAKIRNARSWALVVLFTAIVSAVLMIVLSRTIRLDIQMGMVILAALFALSLTAILVSFENAQQGVARANRKLNKAINMQNTVKIKYVNVTNLLDFYYAKYGVMNSYELSYMWEKFQEEKASRLHDSDVTERIDTARRELYQLLKHYHISDPSGIAYQPRIITDTAEMEEARRALNVQRQRLRKGIDFEVFNLENAKSEIQKLIQEYPQYGQEILRIVEEYEG